MSTAEGTCPSLAVFSGAAAAYEMSALAASSIPCPFTVCVREEVGLAVVADLEGDVDYRFEVDGDAGLQGGAEFPLAQGGFRVGV